MCLAPRLRFLQVAEGRAYWRCEGCKATLLDPAARPSREEELEQYCLHENDPDDPRYRQFLSRLGNPLLERLPAKQVGLDYGCGPGPGLAKMLAEHGHEIHLFDPFFAPNCGVLSRTYDFIICSEVAEHFHNPAVEFDKLDRLLRPGGWLALMTNFQTDDAQFANWHYRRDPTHVVFYREETFRILAERYGWLCQIPAANVVLMQQQKRVVRAGSAKRT